MAEPGYVWLAQSAAELVVKTAGGAPSPVGAVDCDVLVVGSGYGGAVAAARLAGTTATGPGQAARDARIWLVERGLEHVPGDFPSRFAELPGQVRIAMQDGAAARGIDTGLFDLRLGPDVSALLASGLGGGSLINAGVMKRPPAAVFDSGWPAAITQGALDAAYGAALAMLQPAAVPPAQACAKLATLDCLAKAGGQPPPERCPVTVNWANAPAPTPAGVALASCTLCGDCVTGCNQGAKGSLDTNYLAAARARGVEMFCGVSVSFIERAADDSHWVVRWHHTDRACRAADGQPFALRARRVVLAAGTLGSTEILLRSRAHGLVLSPQLGEGFSTNGDSLVAGARHPVPVHDVADPESDPADSGARRVGANITGLLAVPADPQGPAFVVEEASVPAALREVFGEVVAMLSWGAGEREGYLVSEDAIERLSLFALMGDDGAAGRLRLPAAAAGATPAVEAGLRIDWLGAAQLPLYTRMHSWVASSLYPVPAIGTGLLGTGLTVHPLGGCRMGEQFDQAVVDDCGRVFAEGVFTHPGLAVLDGSIVPRALGINPALTIAALAERAVPVLQAEWGLTSATGQPAPPPLPPRPEVRRRLELPAADATWALAECMQGPCKLGGRSYWARLQIEFEPVPGLRKALSLVTRVLGVRRAVLRLQPVPLGTDEFTDLTDTPICCEAELAGVVRLFMPLPLQDHCLTLDYQLSVQAVQGAGPLAPGARIDGRKVYDSDPLRPRISPWRQLSEMDVRIAGQPVGRWALDVGDLADRRDPLVRLLGMSSMPDALADLGAMGLYLLRQQLPALIGAATTTARPRADHLGERWPGPLDDGTVPTVTLDGAEGARLSCYAAGDGGAAGRPPVLLIHGLGSSGSSFTHRSLPCSLALWLRRQDRQVWVLDLRSSIGNEPGRHSAGSRAWTIDSVAQDIPWAVKHIYEASSSQPVDVLAHCMGAVMFCLVALRGDGLRDLADPGKPRSMVRALVLSQVGPLVRLSPLNRLRGYLAGWLQQYLHLDEVDTCPDFVSCIGPGGAVQWRQRPRTMAARLVDALVATFPYPDPQDNQDDEAQRAGSPGLQGSDFRNIRHRADAIFGQLFELRNLADSTLAALDALLGWVKVPMLAQGIHFARRNMLTDVRGRNAAMRWQNFACRFAFPVLLVHGRRNRLFDWRGSWRSLALLCRLRGQPLPTPQPVSTAQGQQVGHHWGAGTATQLALFDDYGHQDCLIGRQAADDIFPVVESFLAQAATLPAIHPVSAPLQAEVPWIGPMLGWLRPAAGGGWQVKLLLAPQPQRAETQAVLVARVQPGGEALAGRVQLTDACVLPWPAGQRQAALDLEFVAGAVGPGRDRFAVFTLHRDLPLVQGPGLEGLPWLVGSEWAGADVQAVLVAWLADPRNAPLLPDALFTLSARCTAAADAGTVAPRDATRPALRFALASCQYPPGLMDAAPASASFARLQAEAAAPDSPQCLLLVGDQVYLDAAAGLFDGPPHEPTRPLLENDLDQRYELVWRMRAFRRTAAALPVLTMLDDHEVCDNWPGWASTPGPQQPAVQACIDAYGRYQEALNPVALNPVALPAGSRASRSYRVHPAGLPFFVVDTRTQRSTRDAGTVGTATIISPAEMTALCGALAKLPRDIAKFIVLPSPILPPERYREDAGTGAGAARLGSDSWSGFPASAAQLLGFIRKEVICRVVFLSGDSHLSSVTRFTFEGRKNSVVSIVSSGLYTPWPFANQTPDQVVLDGLTAVGEPPVHGTMELLAISAEAGYAIVDLSPDPETTDADRLTVSLRPARGGSIDSQVSLTSVAAREDVCNRSTTGEVR